MTDHDALCLILSAVSDFTAPYGFYEKNSEKRFSVWHLKYWRRIALVNSSFLAAVEMMMVRCFPDDDPAPSPRLAYLVLCGMYCEPEFSAPIPGYDGEHPVTMMLSDRMNQLFEARDTYQERHKKWTAVCALANESYDEYFKAMNK